MFDFFQKCLGKNKEVSNSFTQNKSMIESARGELKIFPTKTAGVYELRRDRGGVNNAK